MRIILCQGKLLPEYSKHGKKLTVKPRYDILYGKPNYLREAPSFMERVNKLLHHPDFIKNLNHLEALEINRIYCHHGLSHLLDVARIACLLQYKKIDSSPIVSFSDEIVYASALLHDIGRVLQYEQNIPHETAGLSLAKQILQDCNFTISEQDLILDAIQFHRINMDCINNTYYHTEKATALRCLLHNADKLSRNCFACAAANDCYWPNSKKNWGIIV